MSRNATLEGAKETTSTKTEKWFWTMNLIRLQQSFFQYGSKIVMQTTKLVLDQYFVICFEFQRVCAWTQTSARLFLCSIDAACNQCLWEGIYVPGSSGFSPIFLWNEHANLTQITTGMIKCRLNCFFLSRIAKNTKSKYLNQLLILRELTSLIMTSDKKRSLMLLKIPINC